MGLMSGITTGLKHAPRRVMLYGVHGIGKSTFFSMAENPIFIPTEEGLNDIDCAKFPLAKSHDDVLKAISELYSEKHGYKTVVLDSLDWLEKLIWESFCKQRNVASIEEVPYARGYKLVLPMWSETLAGFNALRNDRGMTVCLTAHASIEKFENPETDTYDRYSPKLHKTASAFVQEWCDEVLFATYKVYTKQSDEGFNRKRNKGLGTGERILRTTERPAHNAKNRLSMPDELPFVYSEYAKYLPNGKTTTPILAAQTAATKGA